MASMINESEQFSDENGKPIVDGYIYIGVAGLDPKLNPEPIYSDRNLTSRLDNPQRTDSYGRSVNKIWMSGRYSLKVEDEDNVQKKQDLDRGENPDVATISLINVQGVNAVTAEAVPAVSAYQDKATYILTVVNTNTAAVTLDFGAGAKSVTKNGDEALIAGDWENGTIQRVIYNETSDRFELLTQSTSEISAAIAALELTIEKNATPIGGYVFVQIEVHGTTPPDNSGDHRWIKLTSNNDGVGQYNEGMLTGESVTGSAPNITATAVISYPSSPMVGQTVRLINTSREFLRPGSSGHTQQSINLAHTHGISGSLDYVGAGNGRVIGSGTTVSSGSSGGSESRPRNMGTTYYMRIA